MKKTKYNDKFYRARTIEDVVAIGEQVDGMTVIYVDDLDAFFFKNKEALGLKPVIAKSEHHIVMARSSMYDVELREVPEFDLSIYDGKNPADIPLTRTGIVRKKFKQECSKDSVYKRYVQSLTIEPEEMMLLRRAFSGGWCGINPIYKGQLCKGVVSRDKTSAYPYQMLSRLFPASKGVRVNDKFLTKETLDRYFDCYLCVFDIKFYGLKARENVFALPLLYDHAVNAKNEKVVDSKIESADEVETAMTNVDFSVFKKCYEWSGFSICNLWVYRPAPLPYIIRRLVRELYDKKSEAKRMYGDEDARTEAAKIDVNSIYGMFVTDVISPDIYAENGELMDNDMSVDMSKLEKYNASKTRFLSYTWGLFVTAWQRKELFDKILELGEDWIYSDTDSIKYFDDGNRESKKDLGDWKIDGLYRFFKSYGSKNYAYEGNGGKRRISISGLSKDGGLEYLDKVLPGGLWENYKEEIYVPEKYSGRVCRVYDEQTKTITEKRTAFDNSETGRFKEYIDGIKYKERIRK